MDGAKETKDIQEPMKSSDDTSLHPPQQGQIYQSPHNAWVSEIQPYRGSSTPTFD